MMFNTTKNILSIPEDQEILFASLKERTDTFGNLNEKRNISKSKKRKIRVTDCLLCDSLPFEAWQFSN